MGFFVFGLESCYFLSMPKLSHDKFDFYTYPNGLRLITVPMDSTQSVTVLVLVATGSRYETKDINGISHFLEHMIFKGTAKRPGTLDIARELDSIGADYNAFTSKEYTGYYVKCAAEKLDIAMDVIFDIFQNSKFDEVEIEKEKGVIIEEINMYLDTPQRYINDIFEELIYDGQPLGYTTQGEKEVIRKLRRLDFAKYFQTHYFDKNTVVAVAGKIGLEEVKEKIGKYFSDIRDNQPVIPEKTTEDQTKPAVRVLYKKTDQTHFNLGFRSYNYFDHKSEVVGIMSAILGGSMSSRLFIEVREKRGLAYYIGSFNNPYADAGYLGIRAGVNNKRLYEALKVSLDECRKLVDELVTQEELKKIKDYIHGKTAIGLESSDDMASFYADQQLLKKELLTPEEKLAIIDKVSVEDVQSAAKEIFQSSRLNLALIGPFQENDQEIQKILQSF